MQYRGIPEGGGPQHELLLAQLAQRADREREVGYTLAGPHRDDLVFLIDGRPADAVASDGQLKTLLIAWKMAEVSFLEEEVLGQPVLLLDDVLSELDEVRSDALMEVIDEFEQVILTSARRVETRPIGRFGQIALDG